jgi:hypothetical protein
MAACPSWKIFIRGKWKYGQNRVKSQDSTIDGVVDDHPQIQRGVRTASAGPEEAQAGLPNVKR